MIDNARVYTIANKEKSSNKIKMSIKNELHPNHPNCKKRTAIIEDIKISNCLNCVIS
jgi:hypothetical protein